MRCVLVFDHLNDIIFSKCNPKFISHIKRLGSTHGLDSVDCQTDNGGLNLNFIMQLFSPIVTSQRVMTSQFGNSYTSIQCQDGLNLVFDEYMGYLFVHLGFEETHCLKRMLVICISIVQHLCGPDVSILKTNESRSYLVRRLLETWFTLIEEDQGVLLEALEQLSVNTDLSTFAIKSLKEATDKLKFKSEKSKSHAMIFVENKFLALYSSKTAKELTPGDLLFLSLYAEWSRKENPPKAQDSSDSEFHSAESSPLSFRKIESPLANSGIYSDLLLLTPINSVPVVPYALHIMSITDSVSLILLHQTQSEALSIALNDALDALNSMSVVSIGNSEFESIKKGMDQLEPAIKKIFESLKKNKSLELSPKMDACVKVLHVKWDLVKKQWSDFSVGKGTASVTSCCHSLGLCLKDLLQFAVLDHKPIVSSHLLNTIRQNVSTSLQDFASFLQIKALRNFTLGSASLSINKYLEEFPGLVHFLYVDRVTHRITAPTLDFESERTFALTKKKIWSMVEFSRLHLQEGHLAIMWKDNTFNYAYYLWFEDVSGTPLKPKVSVSVVVKSLPIPGVISGDFYKRLIELCFPKTSPGKIRCYELYCVHLGLATASCVLEHSRRLAATIWEVTGLPNNPLDLL